MVPKWNHFGYSTHMANVTIKDIDADDLSEVASRATRLGMSTQEYLRRLIAREAQRPVVLDQLRLLAEQRRAGRTPMTMADFDAVRTRAMRG